MQTHNALKTNHLEFWGLGLLVLLSGGVPLVAV